MENEELTEEQAAYEAFMNGGSDEPGASETKEQEEELQEEKPATTESKGLALFEIKVDANGNRVMSEETFIKIMDRFFL